MTTPEGFDPQDAPELVMSVEEQDELRRAGAAANRIRREVNPSSVIGYAT